MVDNALHDDAQSWFDSMGQEIQDFEVPPMPEVEPTEEELAAAEAEAQAAERPYGDAPRVTAEDASSVLNLQRINRPTASIIVGVMDTLMPIAVCLIVKGADDGMLKLDEGERDTLIDAWAVFLGDKNVQASPTAVLIVTMLTIYGAKIFTAVQQRNAAREIAAAQQAEPDEKDTMTDPGKETDQNTLQALK